MTYANPLLSEYAVNNPFLSEYALYKTLPLRICLTQPTSSENMPYRPTNYTSSHNMPYINPALLAEYALYKTPTLKMCPIHSTRPLLSEYAQFQEEGGLYYRAYSIAGCTNKRKPKDK